MTPRELKAARDDGRRQILRIRFPIFYGYESYFTCRTLVRGEILRAYQGVGYPDRKIPDSDTYAQTLVENLIFERSVLEAPEGVDSTSCPAGITKAIAQEILFQSGALSNTTIQEDAIRRALVYANSSEGRAEAIILRYLPGVNEAALERESYEYLFRRTAQAILIAGTMEGIDLEKFINPDDTLLSDMPITETEPVQKPIRSREMTRQTSPKPTPQNPDKIKKAKAIAALKAHQGLNATTNRVLGLHGESIEASQPFMFMAGDVVENVNKIAADINKYAKSPEG
jgi:hypothetical protein